MLSCICAYIKILRLEVVIFNSWIVDFKCVIHTILKLLSIQTTRANVKTSRRVLPLTIDCLLTLMQFYERGSRLFCPRDYPSKVCIHSWISVLIHSRYLNLYIIISYCIDNVPVNSSKWICCTYLWRARILYISLRADSKGVIINWICKEVRQTTQYFWPISGGGGGWVGGGDQVSLARSALG